MVLCWLLLSLLGCQAKLFIGQVEALFLKHRPLFTDQYTLYDFQISYTGLTFRESLEVGQGEPIEIDLLEVR